MSELPEVTTPKPARIGARDLWHDVVDELFSLDRGLPYTFWRLLKSPGAVVHGYLERRDALLTRPLRYFLIASTALAASTWMLQHSAYIAAMAAARGESEVLPKLGANVTWLVAAGLPLVAIVLRGVFHRYGVDFIGCVALATYVQAQIMLLDLPFVAWLSLGGPPPVAIIGLCALMLYGLWAWTDFFGGTRWKTWLLAIVAFVLSQALLGCIVMAIVRVWPVAATTMGMASQT